MQGRFVDAALAGGAAAAVLLAGTAQAAAPDAIRVGGPSLPGDAKVAVVGTKSKAAGKPFKVLNASGAVVLRGKLAAASRKGTPFKHVARADLSAVTAEGSYKVAVGKLRSKAWRVDDDGAATAIDALLGFFAANSDGNEPSPVHGPSHLNDATIANGPYKGQHFDLTGGWMDAGDHLKIGQSIGLSAALLQASARLAPARAGALNAAADVGVRWLVKAHPKPDLFVAFIGDARDHARGWADPAADDKSKVEHLRNRPAYAAVGSDLAGRAAVALALAADRSSGALRDALIAHAEQWYASGKANDAPLKPQFDREACKAFGEPECNFYIYETHKDDLASAAAALHRTTGKAEYLAEAVRYLDEAGDGGRGFDLDDFRLFAAADLCGALGAPPVADAAAKAKGCEVLADAARDALRRRDAFGLAGYYAWGTTGSHGSGGAALGLAGRAGLLDGGLAAAQAGRDWLLGLNGWGRSFVVGFGHKPAKNPHHWARGLGRKGQPRGAVVGGPANRSDTKEQGFKTKDRYDTSKLVYQDDIDNYVTSEPALDYTITNVLMLASIAG